MIREVSLKAALRVCTFLVRVRSLIACLVVNNWPLLSLKRGRFAFFFFFCSDESVKKLEYT